MKVRMEIELPCTYVRESFETCAQDDCVIGFPFTLADFKRDMPKFESSLLCWFTSALPNKLYKVSQYVCLQIKGCLQLTAII
jgi:hypothetical protein